MVDQVAKIKQDVNYLKKELKNTRRKLNRFLDSEKYRKEKKTQPINELEVTLSKGYNNYKREPSIHSHEANINNMTNNHVNHYNSEPGPSLRRFPRTNDDSIMDNWTKITSFIEQIIPLMEAKEAPRKKSTGKEFPFPYEYIRPKTIINLGTKLGNVLEPYLHQSIKKDQIQNRQAAIIASVINSIPTALSTLGIVAVVLVTGTNLIASIYHEVAITDIRKQLGSEFDDSELSTLITALTTRVTTAESDIDKLETKALNTGSSLKSFCKAVDSSTYNCCVNENNNKMRCYTTSVINLTGGSSGTIGISTTNGANTCDDATSTSSTAVICQGD